MVDSSWRCGCRTAPCWAIPPLRQVPTPARLRATTDRLKPPVGLAHCARRPIAARAPAVANRRCFRHHHGEISPRGGNVARFPKHRPGARPSALAVIASFVLAGAALTSARAAETGIPDFAPDPLTGWLAQDDE